LLRRQVLRLVQVLALLPALQRQPALLLLPGLQRLLPLVLPERR
jgi:hypothetical protein